MSCSYTYKGKAVKFRSCSGVPDDMGKGATKKLPIKIEEIGETPVKIVRYQAMTGMYRDILIRSVSWENLTVRQKSGFEGTPHPTKLFIAQEVWEENGYDFESGNDLFVPGLTEVEALENIWPWTAEQVSGNKSIVEGKNHPLVKKMLAAYKKKGAKKAKPTKKIKSAPIKDDEPPSNKFWGRFNEAKNHVKTVKANVTVGEDSVDGYDVVDKKSGKSLGITIHKSKSPGSKMAWHVLHKATGTPFSLAGFRTKDHALKIAYGLSQITDLNGVKGKADLSEKDLHKITLLFNQLKSVKS